MKISNLFRVVLSFCVSLFAIHIPLALKASEQQIYDCFIFFNELDILDIRLNELYDSVDKFVLVESIETFTGNLKPLYFDENRERYQKFMDKIVYIPLNEQIETNNPWDRERYQRDQILRGLKECSDRDIILVSDVDEIPKKTFINKLSPMLKKLRSSWVVFDQKLYRFFLNQFDYVVYPWPGTYASYYGMLKSKSLHERRLSRHSFIHIPDSGWHFSTMGGLAGWVKKVESYSHSERNLPENKTTKHIRDHLDRDCRRVPIDDSFPAYIVQNLQYFIDNGYIDQ